MGSDGLCLQEDITANTAKNANMGKEDFTAKNTSPIEKD